MAGHLNVLAATGTFNYACCTGTHEVRFHIDSHLHGLEHLAG